MHSPCFYNTQYTNMQATTTTPTIDILNYKVPNRQREDQQKELAALIQQVGEGISQQQPEILEQAQQVLAIAKALNLPKETVYGYLQVGQVFFLQDNYAKARYHLSVAEDLLERYQMEDDTLQFKIVAGLGSVYYRRGILDDALSYYLKAYKLIEDSDNDAFKIGLLNNISIVLTAQKNWKKALEYVLSAKKIKGEKEIDIFYIECIVTIGNVYLNLYDIDKAYDYFLKARELALQKKYTNILAAIATNLADLFATKKNFEQALIYAQEAITLEQEAGNKLGIVRTLKVIGEIYTYQEKYFEAISYYRKSLKVAEEAKLTEFIRDLYQNLTKAYESLRNFERAFYYQQKYLAIAQQMLNEEKARTLAEMEIIYETERKEKEAEIYRLRNVELKETLQQLKDTQTQLVQAEKMASLGQLTAGIAHEVNNPINFISGNVQPLKRNIDFLFELIDKYEQKESEEEIEDFRDYIDFEYTKEEIEEMLTGVVEGVSRTRDIVQGLRNFSHLDREGRYLIDVQESLESTQLLLKHQLREAPHVQIRTEYETLPAVSAYGSKLNQVFMNILTNAIQAIPTSQQGEIVIRTKMLDERVQVSIADNGVGIPEAIRERIFEPFFTTKEVGAGTGLGLAISFGIIQEHQGSLVVESEEGKGTTFVIELPIR